jgi:glutamyl-tRNA reductase
MNQLYVFFRGKIKPNLNNINKMKIQEMIEDINKLHENFTVVTKQLHATLREIFHIDGERKDKKVNALLDFTEKNVNKIFQDLINNINSFSSVGSYSTSSVPNGILFNSKFPTYNGKGLQLVPDAVRRNMHKNHKYLL